MGLALSKQSPPKILSLDEIGLLPDYATLQIMNQTKSLGSGVKVERRYVQMSERSQTLEILYLRIYKVPTKVLDSKGMECQVQGLIDGNVFRFSKSEQTRRSRLKQLIPYKSSQNRILDTSPPFPNQVQLEKS